MSNGELFDGAKYEVYVEPTEFDCFSCKETFTDDDPYFEDRRWVDNNQGCGELCFGCYEYDLQHASHATWIHDGEVKRFYIGDHVIMDEYGEEEFYRGEPEFSRVYHSTSGWRGYFETTVAGHVEVPGLTGWTTGDWGDATGNRKATFNDWAEALAKGEIESPVPVIIISDPTSNIFSIAIGVWVAEDDLETFTAWQGDDRAEQLSEALG
jgi:hypothetical protein